MGFERAFEVRVLEGEGEVRVSKGVEVGDGRDLGGGDGFEGLVSSMRSDGDEAVNFDTTALIAMVSGISNGGCAKLLEESEEQMRARFKINYEFVIAQVPSDKVIFGLF